MTDDIVTRLRKHAQNCDCTNAEFDMDEAADEIERLKQEIAQLKTDRNPT